MFAQVHVIKRTDSNGNVHYSKAYQYEANALDLACSFIHSDDYGNPRNLPIRFLPTSILVTKRHALEIFNRWMKEIGSEEELEMLTFEYESRDRV